MWITFCLQFYSVKRCETLVKQFCGKFLLIVDKSVDNFWHLFTFDIRKIDARWIKIWNFVR